MKKRIVVWFMLFAMVAAMFTGCSSIVRKGMEKRGEKAASEADSAAAAMEDATEEEYTVYVYANSAWGHPYVWAWSEDAGDLYEEWPGKKMRLGADGWYYLDLPAEYDNIVVSGQDGEIQTQDELTQSQDIWFIVGLDEYETFHYKPADPTEGPDGYIDVLEGHWEEIYLDDGASSIQGHAKVFDKTVYNCTEMTVVMELEMHNNTNCKDWQIWGRNGGSFTRIGKLHHEAGNGNGSFVIKFDTPVTFDAIALTPTIPGGYSWSLGFYLKDRRGRVQNVPRRTF